MRGEALQPAAPTLHMAAEAANPGKMRGSQPAYLYGIARRRLDYARI
jgi:hypothetical protein